MKSSSLYGVSALGVISVICFLFFNLEWFPGLHGDEAWVGLYADRVKQLGFYTPHLMNTYTGAIFGWISYFMFDFFGTSVFTLRLMSVLCNSAAAIGFTLWAGRRFGPRGALAMAGLLASSGMFLIYGRLAWEVCAFENLLILAILWSCRPFVEEGKFPLIRVLVFFSAIEFGILNHFIFLSVPMSLAVYAVASATLLKDRRAAQLRPLFLLSMVMGVICYCKQYMTPEFFVANRLIVAFGVLVLPLLFTAFHQWVQPRFPRLDFLDGRWARWAMMFVTIVGSIAFCIWHLPPMVQILSGTALMRRVFSLDPPFLIRWFLYLWGAGLFGLLLVRIWEILKTPSQASEGSYARFVFLWTGAYLSVFILMRHTSSIRYYLIMHALVLAAIAAVAAKNKFLSQKRNAVLASIVVMGLHGFYWAEAVATPVRRPIVFRVGFRLEKSIDFIDKRELFKQIDQDRICQWDTSKQDFLYIPAIFHRHGTAIECDQARKVQLEYCWECETAPFYSYVLVKSD